MLALIGRSAGGWVCRLDVYVPPEHVPRRRSIIDAAAVGAGRQPSDIRRMDNVLGSIGPHRVVRLPAGGSAVWRMHWEQVPVGDETSCPVSARMAITPPDEYAPVLVDVAARACGGGRLEVGAVQPPG